MADEGMDNLIAMVLEGDCAGSVSQAKALLEDGVSPKRIVTGGIEAAMSRLNAKCTLEQFNLLEIMLAGRAVMEIMKFLNPSGPAMTGGKGTIVIATLEGDIHDLGKNVLKTVLLGRGYDVVDCGRDCPLQKLIETAVKERPVAVAISGLITPIIPLVRQVKDLLFIRGLSGVKVIAGGAALKQSSSERLNVDFLAESAFDVLPYLDGLAGEAK
jgi:methanogenic corrinoid protein MtbC1